MQELTIFQLAQCVARSLTL